MSNLFTYLSDLYYKYSLRRHDSKFVGLYLISSELYPRDVIGGDFIYVGELINDSSDIEVADLNFLSSLLIYSDNQKIFLDEFLRWWGASVGGNVEISPLYFGVDQLSPSRKKALNKLSLGEWSLNTRFISFLKNSESERLASIELIKCSDLN